MGFEKKVMENFVTVRQIVGYCEDKIKGGKMGHMERPMERNHLKNGA